MTEYRLIEPWTSRHEIRKAIECHECRNRVAWGAAVRQVFAVTSRRMSGVHKSLEIRFFCEVNCGY